MRFILLAFSGLALAACQGADSTNGAAASTSVAAYDAPGIPAANIEAHIRFLADDLMEGRESGTRGYYLAANYVAAYFQLLGLEPGGDDGGWFADVPLQLMRADADAARFSVNGQVFRHGEAVMLTAHPTIDAASLAAGAVFVGYGVSAPDHGHDDYAGLDLTGRIAVIINGAPEGLPGEERSHHASPSTKRDAAAAAGAAGMIMILPAPAAQFAGFAAMQGGRPQTALTAASGPSAYDRLQVLATVSRDAAEAMFDGAEMTLDEALAAARAGESVRVSLGEVSMAQRTIRETYIDPNVVGFIRGSDPDLANEFVVLTAHLDHIGRADAVGPGAHCVPTDPNNLICNGALDNASGVAILIETARVFAGRERPRRSVAFVALAAEEKGLLGSNHFARNPTLPGEMAANVNLDMPIIRYRFNDVVAFGAERSTLGPIATRAAARMGVEVSPDPIPEQNLFVRSDHYNFVRAGVPSVFLMTGHSSPDEADDEGRGFMGFLTSDYHRPGDEVDAGLLFGEGAKFADINYLIAREIADADERPRWNEGDFFGQMFGGGGR